MHSIFKIYTPVITSSLKSDTRDTTTTLGILGKQIRIKSSEQKKVKYQVGKLDAKYNNNIAVGAN